MNIPAARRWSITDTVMVAGLAALALWLAAKTGEELNYRWDWRAPLAYIVSLGEEGLTAGLLWDGLMMSVRLMLIGGALALALGGVVAMLALSPLPMARAMARVYVEGLRHLPPIVFMFVFFYFISSQLFSADFWSALAGWTDNAVGRFLLGEPARAESLVSGVLCLAVFEAAFVSEILRAGVLSVDGGQREAARSLGLSAWQTLRQIVLPQALARVAAPLAGQLVLLVKDSAILSVISVQELTFSAQETAVSTQQIFETWLLAAGLYFLLCAPLLYLCRRLEPRRAVDRSGFQ